MTKATINSREKFQRTLSGDLSGPVPVWPQAFLFPGVFAGLNQVEYSTSAENIVNAQIKALEVYEWDAVGTYPDIVMEPEAYGCVVEIPPEREPFVTKDVILAKNPERIADLKVVDPWSAPRMRMVLEATRELKKRVGDRVMIIGGQRSPLSLACELRGIEDFMIELSINPEYAKELLEFTTQHGIRYAQAQVEAGADVVELGNSSGSLISPEMFEDLIKPCIQRVFNGVKAAGGIPCLHCCGWTSHIHTQMASTGAAIIEIDYPNDMPDVLAHFPEQAWLGNIDPVGVLFQSPPEKISAAVSGLMAASHGKGRFILSTGCEPPMFTPKENMRAFMDAAHEFNARLS